MTYPLPTPNDGCVRLNAVADQGEPKADDALLTGKPRSGVNRAPQWPEKVSLIASLHDGSCDAHTAACARSPPPSRTALARNAENVADQLWAVGGLGPNR